MQHNKGFTIVELLIVIVIIGILAALVIVAYNGIQGRANDTAIQSDLRNIGQKIELYNTDNSAYPTLAQISSGSLGIKATKNSYSTAAGGANMAICISNLGYAVIALSKSNNKFSYSSIDGLKSFTASMSGIDATCASAGINSSDPGYWRIWGYNNGGSGVWVSWIN